MYEDWSNALINWYSVNKRDLPWRNTTNPYYIWLSEIILQQTQVQQGLPYYEKFVVEFPSVFDLANSTEKKVLKLWQGLGYYSRARNLHASAKYIANELQGEFPNKYKEILKLKGVGDYTASAIASISFGEVTAVLDGNVYRVLSRYFGIDTPINTTKGNKEFKTLVQSLIDSKRPAEFNQAIMEFGARQCKPKSPNCDSCIYNSSCYALQHHKVDVLPVKLKKLKIKKRYFNYCVIISSNQHTLLEERKSGIWQNLYQFPLLESKAALNIDAFELALKESTLVKENTYTVSLYNSEDIVHKLSHQHLYTKFWIIQLDKTIEAISVSDLKTYPMPVLISNFAEKFF